jgi:hypothetical protein
VSYCLIDEELDDSLSTKYGILDLMFWKKSDYLDRIHRIILNIFLAADIQVLFTIPYAAPRSNQI